MYNPEKQGRQSGGRFGARKKPVLLTYGGGRLPTVIVPSHLRNEAAVFVDKLRNAPFGAIIPIPHLLAEDPDTVINFPTYAPPTPAPEGPFERTGHSLDEGLAKVADDLVEAGIVSKQPTVGQVTLISILFIVAVLGLMWGCVAGADALLS